MASNSLGLDFSAEVTPAEEVKLESATTETESTSPAPEKKKPYVNAERVKTGGPQREKLSEEELAERMKKMREKNEAIKQRRIDVKADEDAFKETQKHDLIRLEKARKVQESVNVSRQENARRKMDKIQSREWDSGKPAPGEGWKNKKTSQTVPTQSIRISGLAPAIPSSNEEQAKESTTSQTPQGPKPVRPKKQTAKTDPKTKAEPSAVPDSLETTTSTALETS